ncbi:MAG: transcriptional repressor LexA [Deltaproteobacteria bacterium]|nr:transcriptional repressor LexA [Deltaproteobacteria bacterium]
MAMTKRQRQVLESIRSFTRRRGYSPSFQELAGMLGLSSVATVHKHITNLERKGLIRKGWNRSRSLEVVAEEVRVAAVEVPLMGRVAAGQPIEAIPDARPVAVPEEMVGRGDTFVLRVEGDSMIDEQIRDGDLVILEARETAENGELIVGLLEDGSATLKKFYREENGRIRLQPANPDMAPLYVDEAALRIQGVVIGLLRKFR